jgi:hydrogenase nickel incorporation protein HypA/HybF
MHEMTLMVGLVRRIEEIAREHQAARVVRVRVAVGSLAHLSPEHLREHFEEATRGTAAEGAELEIRVIEDLADPNAQSVVLESAEIEEP